MSRSHSVQSDIGEIPTRGEPIAAESRKSSLARNVLDSTALSVAADPKMPYVLVVDDTENIREAVLELLREEGIRALGFADGGAALEHLRTATELPRVILTDLMMPVLDGWELVERVRADARLSGIRVIVMTANPVCAGPHAVRLLRKPFHVTELLGALEVA